MLRTALLLTGHLRCWQMVFPNFKQMVLDRYQPDVFITTWSDEGYWVPQEGATGLHQHSPAVNVEAVYAAYKPIRLIVEDVDPFLPIFAERVKPFLNYYHRPRNI